MNCPRCKTELHPYADRDKWRCKQCVGVLLGERELSVEAPWLLEEPAVSREAAQVACPTCSAAMTPIAFVSEQVSVDLDRCDQDKLVWFDAAELGRVLEVAHAEIDQASEVQHRQRLNTLWFIADESRKA